MISRWTRKTTAGGDKTAAVDQTVHAELAKVRVVDTADPGRPSQQAGPTSGAGSSNGAPAGSGSGEKGAPTIFSKPAPQGAAKKVSEVLGEIVWLMSQSPLHKQFFISDLEWFVMTPVLLKQFRMFYGKDRPIGVVFWAFVNDEVEERLKAGTTKLRPQDWKSGDKLWVVEVIAPFGGAEEMVKDLKAKVFKEREIRFVALGAKGGKEVRVI